MAEANPRTFDLFAPEEVVTQAEALVKLPRDRNSLFQLSKVEQQINSTADKDAVAALEVKAAALKAKVDKSALHVTLRGIDKVMIDSISTVLDAMATASEPPMTDEEKDIQFQTKVLESMMLKIEDADGNAFAHPGERTREWYDKQPPENRIALNVAVKELSFTAYQYEADTINPDF